MTTRTTRRLLITVTCLVCVLVPACPETGSGAKVGGGVGLAPAAVAPTHEPSARADGRAPTPTVKKTAAPGRARVHPFAPTIDKAARAASLRTEIGQLELKGILTGERDVAIIQDGKKVHFVRRGEQIGRLTVREIRESEVVLDDGSRKRILLLYGQ